MAKNSTFLITAFLFVVANFLLLLPTDVYAQPKKLDNLSQEEFAIKSQIMPLLNAKSDTTKYELSSVTEVWNLTPFTDHGQSFNATLKCIPSGGEANAPPVTIVINYGYEDNGNGFIPVYHLNEWYLKK